MISEARTLIVIISICLRLALAIILFALVACSVRSFPPEEYFPKSHYHRVPLHNAPSYNTTFIHAPGYPYSSQ